MKHTGTPTPGYRLDKSGKLVKARRGQSVSETIRQKKSKKVKVKRGRS